ncbi:M1 family metallopeptidase [Nocardioides sp. zg-1228]|uniref:M1 family metallopeptidase n=1 Tax=Nocardioides sp. zg-1228 TaxID=2763008 RepID=UPI001642A989|nr:M1 family metallopeptidase [Nocardioides sp. zg-1228]MBC2931877.1 M1 family metallopeptidase [Nocardioides sp. zg-1228]QSF57442.1 M1 family metallopeptidase [Nocardioides sp. zg-1228]
MRHRPVRAVLAAGLSLAVLAGCSGGGAAGPEELSDPAPAAAVGDGEATASPVSDPEVAERVEPDLDVAVSTPREDSLYPAVGDPRVDALHYDLDLDWDPEAEHLTASATVTFRATRSAPRFQLDLGRPLTVGRLTLDGEPAAFSRRGKDLVVDAPIEADQRYELSLDYVGTPRPIPAPTTRGDFASTGFTVTDAGEVWTMQEPHGAFTWYPVNDHPSDKALYDITVHAPRGWTGIANGRLTDLTTDDDGTTTSWQLTEPASSYLITLAIGDYSHSSTTTEGGLRVDYWTPRGMTRPLSSIQTAAATVDWIETKLGDYPFDTLGLVVTDSQSAMETQTMVTLGNNDYVLSPEVVAHEIVHQWYGDQVSPADWRDVWLNEGMTMLLQWTYEDEHDIRPLRESLRGARLIDQQLRDEYGPPGAYDPRQFGGSNIYYTPALMWNELRVDLGDEEFYAVARSWLAAHDNTSVSREQLYDHWEAETGRELSAFFDRWITGTRTPGRGVPQG